MEILTPRDLLELLQERSQNLQGLSRALRPEEEQDWGSPQVRKLLRVLALESLFLSEVLAGAEKKAGVSSMVVETVIPPEAEVYQFPVGESAANDPE
jgi:hypothetical protein